jgi:cell division transport system permease protein
MYLVGATQGFIRKPFILRGIKQGIVAGIFASILLGVFIFVLIRVFPELTKTQDPNQLLLLILGVIILGVLISSLSSALSIRRYLRLKADDLHF